MPGAMFGAGTGAAYAALSSGPRDTPQRVLMTPTQRDFVPQLKSLPHTQQIPPPTGKLSRRGLTAHRAPFLGSCETQACRDSLPGLAQSPAGQCVPHFLGSEGLCSLDVKAECALSHSKAQPCERCSIQGVQPSPASPLTALQPSLGSAPGSGGPARPPARPSQAGL